MSTNTKAIKLEQLQTLAARSKAEADKLSEQLVAYSIVKQETAETGFIATYQLTRDGTAVGEKINIPKDFLVKEVTLKDVETADQPYTGAKVGEKYIDFIINAKDGGAEESHLYLSVKDLVNVYTGGDGITVTDSSIALKVNSANANGLTVDENGLALSAATSTTAGAMSAADKIKLDSIQFATDEEVSAMLDSVFGV